MLDQIPCAKGHVINKWLTVSSSDLHFAHTKGPNKPLFIRFLPVRILFFKTSHPKTLSLGGRCQCHSKLYHHLCSKIVRWSITASYDFLTDDMLLTLS